MRRGAVRFSDIDESKVAKRRGEKGGRTMKVLGTLTNSLRERARCLLGY